MTQRQLRLVFRVLLYLVKAERKKAEAEKLEIEIKEQLDLMLQRTT